MTKHLATEKEILEQAKNFLIDLIANPVDPDNPRPPFDELDWEGIHNQMYLLIHFCQITNKKTRKLKDKEVDFTDSIFSLLRALQLMVKLYIEFILESSAKDNLRKMRLDFKWWIRRKSDLMKIKRRCM